MSFQSKKVHTLNIMEVKLTIVFCVLAVISALANADSRIIGGDPAPSAEYPYQVSLQMNKIHFCGGSIVNKNTILTSAQCVDGLSTNGLSVLVGTTKLNSGGIQHSAAKIVIHENYDRQTKLNDVAIVRLKTYIRYDKYVQPISICKDPPFDNEKLLLTGWGSTSKRNTPNDLQSIELQSLDSEECAKRLQGKGSITKGQLCTNNSRGKGACEGDYGGPLVNSYAEQVGILSWSVSCAQGLPDVYSNVAYYRNWILGNAKARL